MLAAHAPRVLHALVSCTHCSWTSAETGCHLSRGRPAKSVAEEQTAFQHAGPVWGVRCQIRCTRWI